MNTSPSAQIATNHVEAFRRVMREVQPKTAKEILEQMKKLSAEIGVMELKRMAMGSGQGKEYISPTEIRAKKREFARLQVQHKKLYFK